MAVNYSLPASIGSGAFAACSGSGTNYSCSGNLTLADADTLVLSSNITLAISGNFIIGKNVSISNSGFQLNFNVGGNVTINQSATVSANFTGNGNFTTKNNVSLTGNISMTGNVELGKINLVNGNIIAGGTLIIANNSTVNGSCSPTHAQCTGGGGGSGRSCTTTQIAANGEEFRGISGSSDSNVIAVGKNGGIYHYNGSSWVKNAFVSNEELNDVEVVNASLAYAVGKKGKVVIYNGTGWSTLPAPNGEELLGVWAASASEVWVVGKMNSLYRWNGSSWTNMSGAAQANVDNNQELTDIWGGATYQYSLEKDGDLYRYTRPGGPWSKITACSATFNMEAQDIWGDGAGNIYLAGKDRATNPDSAAVFVYNQASNSCSKAFSTTTENEVTGISGNAGTIAAVGKKGLVLESISGSWSESKQGTNDFMDVWVSSSGTVYSAGKNGFVTTCGDATLPLDHFRITPANFTASTCLANAITITAEDVNNAPVSNYTGTVNISTSRAHGNWSIGSGGGILSPNPDNDDNGVASYSFVVGDASRIVLNLRNTHAESLTISVNDAGAAITSTSAAVNFSRNVFVVTPDPIQVAGRPQAMNIAMWTDNTPSAGCGIDPNYNNPAQNLVANINRFGVLNAAADPSIGGIAIPDTPATAGIVLNFSLTPGQASFNLDSSDVGQYVLTISDITNSHSSATITGDSGLLTVKPFGLAVTNIMAGATPNPGANTSGGTIFTSAGSNFSATVSAVLWDAADDTNNDGILDTGLYANNTIAPSFAAATNLNVSASGFEPNALLGGVAGSLINNSATQADFEAAPVGSATLNNLKYSEVGSFTLQASSLDYLGEATADIIGDDIIVGRFIPASFQVSLNDNGMLDNACGVFTYIGQEFTYLIEPQFRVTAMNALPVPGVTTNYLGAWVKLDANSASVDVATDSSVAGTDAMLLDLRYNKMPMTLTINNNGTVDYRFGADIFAYGPDSTVLAYSKQANSEVPPFTADIDPLLSQIDDGEVPLPLAPLAQTFNLAGNQLRFGRLAMRNAHGSEIVDLSLPVFTETLQAGGYYSLEGDDSCSQLATMDLGIIDNLSTPGASAPITVSNPTAIGGQINVNLPAPGSGIDGSILVTPDLQGSLDNRWLRYDWTSSGQFANDPSATASFGIFQGSPVQIFIQQTFQ